MNRIIISFLLLLLCSSCYQEEFVTESTYECEKTLASVSSQHPQNKAFLQLVERASETAPGFQIALITPDRQRWTYASGMADFANEVPLQPCSRTMVGSISKVFTATLIMQLVEEETVSLDDPLDKWLDVTLIQDIENAQEVTVRQLLDHTSGIRDYLSTKQFFQALNEEYLLETQEEKLAYAYGKPAYHAPDEQHTYSNTNYVLLGLIVESARNMTLWEAVEVYISERLFLENCLMGTESEPIPEGTARAYARTPRGNFYDIMHIAVSDAATGDGGISSNMEDLTLFMGGLFNGNLVSTQTRNLMTDMTVAVPVDQQDFPQWEGEQYGLGLLRMNTPYGVAYGHTGSTSDYNTLLFFWPESGACLAIGYTVSASDDGWEARKEMREGIMEAMFE